MVLKGREVMLGGGSGTQAEGWDIYSWKEEGEAEEIIKLGLDFVGRAIGLRPSWKFPQLWGVHLLSLVGEANPGGAG